MGTTIKETLHDRDDTVEVEGERGFSAFYPRNFSCEYGLDKGEKSM